jgi:hypothetical protein
LKVGCNLVFRVSNAPADPGEAEPAALTLAFYGRRGTAERVGDLLIGH